MKLVSLETNEVIAEEVKQARSFFTRLRGLMFTDRLPSRTALHLIPCTSVHTFFMNYAIDVIHLDDKQVITGMECSLQPGKWGKRFSGTRSVVELPAGKINASDLETGKALAFIESGKQQASTKGEE